MDINTCFETTKDSHVVAYYTHLFPIFLSFFLSIYLLRKTKYSLLSQIFFFLTLGFNVWLICDIITWTQQSYDLINFVWSLFDYTNVVFFLYGLYFFLVLLRNKDISTSWKWVGLLVTLPALLRVLTGNSIHGFNQSVCESNNDDFLVAYKNYVEIAVVASIAFFSGLNLFKEKNKQKRNQVTIVAIGLLIFFGIFSLTDYVSALTGIYEVGLYGLFIMPVFLGLIVYSIVKYQAFNIKILGAQSLVVSLVTLVGSQFFFIDGLTSIVLNIVTTLLILVFGYFLVIGVKREVEQREKIEKLAKDLQKANDRLQELDKQKSEFVSFASHQLRSPLTSMRGYASLLLEGDYGDISDKVKEAVTVIYKSTRSLVSIVEDYLNISRMELGTMKYDMKVFDSKELLKTVISEQKPNIDLKSLALNVNIDESRTYMINADSDKFKQVLMNTIDNSVKYTPSGSINVSIEKDEKRHLVRFAVTDTGVGIAKETLPKLFKKFSRADHASESNIHGTGLGLFIARQMMDAHGGRIWAESAGENKGSQFYVEIPEAR